MRTSQNSCPDSVSRASQQRIEALECALQDAYSWAHTSGRLSELNSIMERAAVPLPAGSVTRTRMARVWEEGCERFPAERSGELHGTFGLSLSWMLHYSSRLIASHLVPRGAVLDGLWKIANAASQLLSEDFDVLTRALEEYSRAAEKHPGMTLECDGHTDATRLFALVEEIGEVAACLTYDNNAETGHGSDLESEVIQVVALALAWATRYLDDEGR